MQLPVTSLCVPIMEECGPDATVKAQYPAKSPQISSATIANIIMILCRLESNVLLQCQQCLLSQCVSHCLSVLLYFWYKATNISAHATAKDRMNSLVCTFVYNIFCNRLIEALFPLNGYLKRRK